MAVIFSARTDVQFKAAGVGHHSNWRRDDCKQQRTSFLGRRKFRRGWRCAECVAAKARSA